MFREQKEKEQKPFIYYSFKLRFQRILQTENAIFVRMRFICSVSGAVQLLVKTNTNRKIKTDSRIVYILMIMIQSLLNILRRLLKNAKDFQDNSHVTFKRNKNAPKRGFWMRLNAAIKESNKETRPNAVYTCAYMHL